MARRALYIVARFNAMSDEPVPLFAISKRSSRAKLTASLGESVRELLEGDGWELCEKALGAYYVTAFGSYDRDGIGSIETPCEGFYVTLPLTRHDGAALPKGLDARVAAAAEWAGDLYETRTLALAEGRTTNPYDVSNSMRVPWSEIWPRFEIGGPDNRNRFQPFFDKVMRRLGLWRLLQDRETVAAWYERRQAKGVKA